MNAKQFLESATRDGKVVRLARMVAGKCTGRGQGLILDRQQKLAVLLEDCGDPHENCQGIGVGAIVSFEHFPDAHPDDQYQILEDPVYVPNQARLSGGPLCT